jgi:hypothetical protein
VLSRGGRALEPGRAGAEIQTDAEQHLVSADVVLVVRIAIFDLAVGLVADRMLVAGAEA